MERVGIRNSATGNMKYAKTILTQVAGLGQKKAAIPFKIGGTTSNPTFIPDFGGTLGTMVATPAQGAEGVLGNLGGLFGKKKKQ